MTVGAYCARWCPIDEGTQQILDGWSLSAVLLVFVSLGVTTSKAWLNVPLATTILNRVTTVYLHISFLIRWGHIFVTVVHTQGLMSFFLFVMFVDLVYVWLYCWCMQAYAPRVWLVSTEVRRSSGTGVMNGCEMPCGSWESNPGPL